MTTEHPTSPAPAQRTEGFTESVIREMTRLAHRFDALNLAQGFPDFPAPEAIKEAAVRAIMADVNQYAITWGAPSLRRALADKYARHQGLEVDPEREITVCCGATEAMISALLAVINPGDEVIVFEPFYENYGPDAILSGATPRYVSLHAPDWRIDPEELASAFGPRTKAIILNTPNNPTGKVFSRAELEMIASLCTRWNALAVTDEIYEHIVYDGATHLSIATLPGMRERTITISGISKTYAVTGWRIGYCIAPPRLTDAIRKVHDFLTVGAPAPLQEAAAVAMGFDAAYYAELARAYQERRDVLVAALREAGFACRPPAGAYYIMADISALGFSDDVQCARWLVEHAGVAAVPGSSFYHGPGKGSQQIRFAFPKRLATLEEAGRRLLKVRDSLG
ncbi:MAG TPA: aminotransferase class I/II-fold pyridoxal phosphate-dependent enzyme [Armatimonadota bacterium]|nr:aminotransferase class I/II-fold pyridoxal phosphate-dependent enzyme [Armatimonadota bacterium]HOJ20843.1 aminotransferase class I/II-fold pyridoxal phosphate-dependent enzyme [Armatimonadota bacterium]HOM80819.1 aminotransferase class I/II-fold pyridoxal phosphate-dependent enzyme [Armatimonadota bacterium]HPO72413.1 aminotransferase class I/II-fold pyridoxal phosphate-dependent enzyme [Armatimonadota bacterium]HPT99059.1 aminotransferase class I/II-fold pyridoxal phosphate-dependent enzym